MSHFARIAVALSAIALPLTAAGKPPAIGAGGDVGCRVNPKRAARLDINKPGVYENYLIDGQWARKDLVRIKADGVTLRNCEIRNGCRDGVEVYAKDVTIENCKIHHLLAGTFKDQMDAHGITGRPTNLVIRNCEIYLVTGDAAQFDPGRGPWDNVLIENCTFWTAPLKADAAGFKKGQRPGENAIDTKQQAKNPRSRLTVRNCYFHGWGDGQITNMAAVNVKDHVQVTLERCLLADNEICFRLRGPTGPRGGALVTIRDCAVYRSTVAVRTEDRIRDLKICRLGLGEKIDRPLVRAGGGYGAGYVNEGQYTPPPLEKLRAAGFEEGK